MIESHEVATRNINREQKLIDICFECVAVALDKKYRTIFDKMTQDELMNWVALQLKGCGFDTEPCGASWGVLKI